MASRPPCKNTGTKPSLTTSENHKIISGEQDSLCTTIRLSIKTSKYCSRSTTRVIPLVVYPLLFNLYINDMPSSLGTRTNLFADDIMFIQQTLCSLKNLKSARSNNQMVKRLEDYNEHWEYSCNTLRRHTPAQLHTNTYQRQGYKME